MYTTIHSLGWGRARGFVNVPGASVDCDMFWLGCEGDADVGGLRAMAV